MATSLDPLTSARAEALFVSGLSARRVPTKTEAVTAIKHAVRTHGSSCGCAGEVAAAYGEHPETAAPRMRWARAVIENLFPRQDITGPAATTGSGLWSAPESPGTRPAAYPTAWVSRVGRDGTNGHAITSLRTQAGQIACEAGWLFPAEHDLAETPANARRRDEPLNQARPASGPARRGPTRTAAGR
jgi:hypothetical protein